MLIILAFYTRLKSASIGILTRNRNGVFTFPILINICSVYIHFTPILREDVRCYGNHMIVWLLPQ